MVLLVASALLCAGLSLASSALAANTIYWGNTFDEIGFANLDGSGGGGKLNTTGANVEKPLGVALDPANGRIYWANHAGAPISFANLNGTGGGNLNTTGAPLGGPVGIAIDAATGLIYWANDSGNSIAYAHLDGSGGGTLIAGAPQVENPSGLAIDAATGMIYWVNGDGESIGFAHIDGSKPGTLETKGAKVKDAQGVAIDPVTGVLYWANGTAGISFAAANDSGGGGNLETPGVTPNGADGVAIDPTSERVYWTDNTDNQLEFAALNGSGGGELSTKGIAPSGPAFPALLEAPVGAGVPVLGGGTLVGSTLSCAAGSWASDLSEAFDFRAPQSFVFAWSENGAPIAGAASSTLVASSPGSYACQVTASNPAGSTTQSSAALTITAAPKPFLSPPLAAAKPVITHLSESAKIWRAGSRRAQISAKKPPLGTTFSFTLNIAASVSFAFTQPASGRRVGRKCVAQTGRNRHKAKCARTISAGVLTPSAHAGANKVRFDGVISSHRTLKPGSYTLLVSATSAGGHSATSTLHFTIAP